MDYSSCFLLFTFVFILNGSPFINNYKGFNGSSESSSNGEPIWIESSNKILVDKDEFKNLLKEGKFDDYEYLTTRSFIFKETGIVAGYYDPNYDYKPLSIMTFFLFPFLESVIKSAIWIPIYYLLLMLSPKVRKTYIEKMPDVKVITINV
ncbi:hypothetical protein ABZR88_21930 [Mucilaginibacter yixingensis]|uniref:hypothetical protein n=1 Tax=Mucilaginibacter yixingensis TaxID=1295612 RepID=UPI000D30FA1F|nr:hypothetical protein [Mucilaginibacter yixingensis]